MKSCGTDTQWCNYLHVSASIIPWKLTWTQVKSGVAEKNNTMRTGYAERLNPDSVQCRGFRENGLCVTDRNCPGRRSEGRNCHWYCVGTVCHKRDGIWFGRVRWWRWLWYLNYDNKTFILTEDSSVTADYVCMSVVLLHLLCALRAAPTCVRQEPLSATRSGQIVGSCGRLKGTWRIGQTSVSISLYLSTLMMEAKRPWLRRLVDVPPRKPGFDPGLVRVGFVVERLALCKVISKYVGFSLSLSFYHCSIPAISKHFWSRSTFWLSKYLGNACVLSSLIYPIKFSTARSVRN